MFVECDCLGNITLVVCCCWCWLDVSGGGGIRICGLFAWILVFKISVFDCFVIFLGVVVMILFLMRLVLIFFLCGCFQLLHCFECFLGEVVEWLKVFVC